MPNVFVLCTGRCGSLTFARACAHATNYTAAHESRTAIVGPDRLDYRPDHIEVDNRLSWFLGRMDDEFGDAAYYVHLQREHVACARSFSHRNGGGIMAGYRHAIAIGAGYVEPLLLAGDLIDTVNANIRLFLKDKTRVMPMHLYLMREQFPRFWEWIDAEGDLGAAMREWDIKHNATKGLET